MNKIIQIFLIVIVALTVLGVGISSISSNISQNHSPIHQPTNGITDIYTTSAQNECMEFQYTSTETNNLTTIVALEGLVANYCTVMTENGTVISRGTFIGENCVLDNPLIMTTDLYYNACVNGGEAGEGGAQPIGFQLDTVDNSFPIINSHSRFVGFAEAPWISVIGNDIGTEYSLSYGTDQVLDVADIVFENPIPSEGTDFGENTGLFTLLLSLTLLVVGVAIIVYMGKTLGGHK